MLPDLFVLVLACGSCSKVAVSVLFVPSWRMFSLLVRDWSNSLQLLLQRFYREASGLSKPVMVGTGLTQTALPDLSSSLLRSTITLSLVHALAEFKRKAS